MLPHNVGLVYFHIIYALKFLEKKMYIQRELCKTQSNMKQANS